MLPDTAVLHRDPETRLAQSEDGHLLVRHRRGVTMRAPIALEDLSYVLEQVDGERTIADIVARCSQRFETEDIRNLLNVLVGDVLRETPPPEPERLEIVGEARRSRFRRLAILGGGTAGYLTALALRRKLPDLSVTLIESSKLGVIGVGEATTPLMPQFLHVDLGISPRELFEAVAPTLKLGIHFEWGGRAFLYPFGPNPIAEALTHGGGRGSGSFWARLMGDRKLPLSTWEVGPPHMGFGTEVAYHLDNRRFVAFLKKKALAAGIAYRDLIIERARLDDRGEIAALIDEDGGEHDFEFFVDCSGFRSLLIGETLGVPFQSFARSLFSDRAWAASVPGTTLERPFTTAQAMAAGWCWNVPQMEETHIGYVFSSDALDENAALEEMRARYPGMGEARPIRFRSGRRRDFWAGNAVALGNAHAFVEPLESTALHMLIREIGVLVQILEHDLDRGAVNRRVGGWWDYLCWFLAIHYRFNQGMDTPFWRRCRAETDVSAHADLIERYRERGPLQYQNLTSRLDTQDPLWGPEGIDVILTGQGLACPQPTPARDFEAWRSRQRVLEALLVRCLNTADAHRLLNQQPGLLDVLAKSFTEEGPAFG